MALGGPWACVVWDPLSKGPSTRSLQPPWWRQRQRSHAVQASASEGSWMPATLAAPAMHRRCWGKGRGERGLPAGQSFCPLLPSRVGWVCVPGVCPTRFNLLARGRGCSGPRGILCPWCASVAIVGMKQDRGAMLGHADSTFLRPHARQSSEGNQGEQMQPGHSGWAWSAVIIFWWENTSDLVMTRRGAGVVRTV